MSTQIVQHFEGELRVSSEMVAERTENQHKNVLELIRANRFDIEAFGPIAFETRMGEALPQGGFARSTQVAHLNEPQSTFLITLMRNSEVVKEFKLELVKQFYEMRAALVKPKSLEERSLELIGDLNAKVIEQAHQLEAQQPLVDQALTYQGGVNLTTRQEFAREIITWGSKQGFDIKQSDVFKFLTIKLKLFIGGNRSDTGLATMDAIRQGFAVTEKGTAPNGHNYATGKLTVEGKAYAWERVTRYLNAEGTLRLPVKAVA